MRFGLLIVLIAMPVLVWANGGVFPCGSWEHGSGGTCTTWTTDQSMTTTDSEYGGTDLPFGQSFVFSTSGTVGAIHVALNGGAGDSTTVTCDFGTSADPETDNLDTGTASVSWSSGGVQEVEIEMPNHPAVNSTTTYFFGCKTSTTQAFQRYAADGNNYTSGDYYYGSSGYPMAQYTSRDLYFKVDLCD